MSGSLLQPSDIPSIIIDCRRADIDLTDLPISHHHFKTVPPSSNIRLNLFSGTEYARRPLADAELADMLVHKSCWSAAQHDKRFSEIKHDASVRLPGLARFTESHPPKSDERP